MSNIIFDQYFLLSMLPITVVISLLAIAIAYLMIQVPKTYTLKWALIPIVILGSFYLFTTFGGELGYPINVNVREDVFVMSFRVAQDSSGNKKIELWTVSVDDQSRSRLYSVPYDPKLEKKLREGQKAGRKGAIMVMRKRQQSDPKNADNSEQSLQIILPPHQLDKPAD